MPHAGSRPEGTELVRGDPRWSWDGPVPESSLPRPDGTPINSAAAWAQLTQHGRPPGAASFANRLMLRAAARRGIDVPAEWWKARHTEARDIHRLLCAAKDRIGAMECRVVAFNDDSKGLRSSVAEIYIHTQLATRYTTSPHRDDGDRTSPRKLILSFSELATAYQPCSPQFSLWAASCASPCVR
jgi:hypothetical protein